ncbi:MAG: 50S ribosomal protein L4 [Candidatus Taylorbacteria bacterium RIFCSPLOWO2_02_50_13]|nr:MAG: 50S ribosomal protein L4 [Candidatus Taylorbacteria bacterium RIFCSPLOWO2_01_FULL_50_130]OHA36194.1 MAG: 50S ribosomal protein L4 [Candidatus Taylorbacteria bacterium RIFCSPLOWO2_02_50_13]HCB35652.1 50S ribosomal protein L4 [Candidatus Taylorbacteria bacterium]
MEAKVYNQEGKEAGSMTLPERVFGAKWNADLVHQVAQSMLSNRRAGTAHTKNRGEVSGGGKKPWRQKGTGRARHGSIRSPIWVGGGVAHGPRSEKNYARKINRKQKSQALYSALSRKLREGEILFLNGIALPEIKAKAAKEVLERLSRIKGYESLSRRRNAASIVIPVKDVNIAKSFRNFGNVSVGQARNLNLLDVLTYKYLVVVNPKDSIKSLIKDTNIPMSTNDTNGN